MAFTVRITFDDDTELTRKYRLFDLVKYIKEHPLSATRKPTPILPWLIEAGLEYGTEGPHRNPIKRIDIQEKVTI